MNLLTLLSQAIKIYLTHLYLASCTIIDVLLWPFIQREKKIIVPLCLLLNAKEEIPIHEIQKYVI